MVEGHYEENIGSYDIFEKLHEKYTGTVDVAPERAINDSSSCIYVPYDTNLI